MHQKPKYVRGVMGHEATSILNEESEGDTGFNLLIDDLYPIWLRIGPALLAPCCCSMKLTNRHC